MPHWDSPSACEGRQTVVGTDLCDVAVPSSDCSRGEHPGRCHRQQTECTCIAGPSLPLRLYPNPPAHGGQLQDFRMHVQARKVSTSDIQLVQNLIERCLQMYLSQREVIATLQSQAKIEPGFTGLVWQVRAMRSPCFQPSSQPCHSSSLQTPATHNVACRCPAADA